MLQPVRSSGCGGHAIPGRDEGLADKPRKMGIPVSRFTVEGAGRDDAA
jgi:hypothetical protein